jgi:hypothetical protein
MHSANRLTNLIFAAVLLSVLRLKFRIYSLLSLPYAYNISTAALQVHALPRSSLPSGVLIHSEF